MRIIHLSSLAATLLSLVSGLFAGPVTAQDSDGLSRGQPIYQQLCLECHGPEGQGNADGRIDRLVGDLSVAELADIISNTMPEDDPDACVGSDAQAVAAYIHDSFYSPAAQSRRNPPRVRLARLTGQQLRQSIADLYAHFGDQLWTTQNRGIEGTYFSGAGWGEDRLRIKRIDDGIDFDFGRSGPGEEIDPRVYYIHWNGSLLVPATGRYEIIVRSTSSFTMQFGRLGPLLFDNHVQSEGKEEFRQSFDLVGGRVYPIKLELQQRERKTEQPPVRISLSWVPPAGIEQIIPKQQLLPDSFPSSFALQSNLPPDDRSYGFERGIAIDRGWDQSITDVALEFADVAIADLFPTHQKRFGSPDDPQAATRHFLVELLQTAFRQSIDDQTKSSYIDQAFEVHGDDNAAVIRYVVLKCLKSPRFLYPLVDNDQPPSRRAANRLAFVLFDSLPSDPWLIRRIEDQQLQTPEQLDDAAWKMVDDYRAQAKIRSFLYHWLDLDDLGEITKDDQLFPGFDQQLVSDLKRSLDAFLDQVVQSDSSDFRQLLQADWGLTNDRIASFYGDPWISAGLDDSEDGFTRSVSDPTNHVGILTHPILMSHFAYHKTSSPIHRGVFLSRYVLGRVIRPPAEAFTPLDPTLHPDLTTRQRVELQTGDVNCQVCHQKINSLGFALEHFDAVGRYRVIDNGRPVDPSGSYQPRQGRSVQFAGARELGDHLATSDDCHRAFVEAAFEHFVKQPLAAYEATASDELTDFFRQNDYNIRQLIVRIATIVAEHDIGRSAPTEIEALDSDGKS